MKYLLVQKICVYEHRFQLIRIIEVINMNKIKAIVLFYNYHLLHKRLKTLAPIINTAYILECLIIRLLNQSLCDGITIFGIDL